LRTGGTEMSTRVKSLEERVDEMDLSVVGLTSAMSDWKSEYASFKAKIDTTLAFMRWIGIFTAGVLVTAIVASFNVSHSAGRLEARVEQLQETVVKQECHLDEQNKLLREVSAQLAELRAKGAAVELA